MMDGVVGVAWFTPEDWVVLRAIVPDADEFAATFDEWYASVEKHFVELRAAGLRPRRVPIAVRSLLAWCDIHGRLPDADARTEFIALELQRLLESSAPPGDI